MATNVDAKLLKQTKFPPEFNQKVDMKKVNVEVMKKWIASKISEVLGNEDDVVIELCFNLLEGSRFPDIKVLQIQLTGFLDKDTPRFCKELWTLCLSAQSNPQGVPKELLEAKKLELIQEKRKAPKRPSAEKSKRGRRREISITSASESALSEGEVVGEVTDNATITTDGLRGTQGLRLLAAVHHRIVQTIARPPSVTLWIHIFLVGEIGDNMVVVASHHLLGDLTADRFHVRERLLDGIGNSMQDLSDAITA
ncbi:MAG: hypothetical protein Q9220_001382 [cf. Caloplaca sp. 1 TL-2023]